MGSVDEATRRLVKMIRAADDGQLRAEVIECDPWMTANRDCVAAAAHALATEPAVIVGEEADAREWFPYSFMIVPRSNRT